MDTGEGATFGPDLPLAKAVVMVAVSHGTSGVLGVSWAVGVGGGV